MPPDVIITGGKGDRPVFLMHDGHRGGADMQEKPLVALVQVRFGGFPEAMTMARDLAMREDGVREFFPPGRQGLHGFNHDIAVPILSSHELTLPIPPA